MGDEIITFGREHAHVVLSAAGALLMVGSVLNWRWVVEMTSPSRFPLVRTWLEVVNGKEARLAFERAVSFCCGFVLTACGAALWWFRV